MINIQQFKSLQKKSSQSFHQQKKLIKNLMLGKPQYCPICKEKLAFKSNEKGTLVNVYCVKGCTDIELDIS